MKRLRSISTQIRLVAVVLLLSLAGSGAAAQVLELAGTQGPVTKASRTEAPQAVPLLEYRALSEGQIHRLGPLSVTETEELKGSRGLDSDTERTRVGIVRTIPTPVGFSGRANARGLVANGGRLDRTTSGAIVWTAGFSSAGAGALRLRLDPTTVPRGTVAFVYSAGGEVHGPYDLNARPRDFWTNTVFADEVFVEVQFPRDSALNDVQLTVGAIGHLEHEAFGNEGSGSFTESLPGCFKDASCVSKDQFPEIEDASRAIAHITYLEGTAAFVCTGGLLNTTKGTSVPYLLTANHCVASAESASTVEAFWDYRTKDCGTSAILQSNIERTLGASMLATGSRLQGKADFTLLQLAEQPPPGRYYLGWSATRDAIAANTTLYRIAHPAGAPQSFSVHRVSTVPTPGACEGLPTSTYIYSKSIDGATKGGSSGSPLMLRDGLKVVGQLYGRCGRNLDDACDAVENSAVDGSFATYYDEIKQWLAPKSLETCRSTAVSLCLAGGRFRVEVLARDPRSGRGTTGTAIPQNDVFGYFSLPELTGQVDNPEVFVKVVNGTTVNGKHWVFYGGLTDLEFGLTVTDVQTGTVKTYMKDAGAYCGSADTNAF